MSNPLIDRLRIMFGEPEHANVDAYTFEIRKLTDHFGDTALDKAASHLIRNGGKSWPAPKAIVDACVAAREAVAAAEAARPARRDKPKMPWESHDERANQWAVDFCKHTVLGRQAFDEGWGRPLFLYAKSFAREAYRHNAAPDRAQLSVSDGWLRYYRGSADLSVNRDDLVRSGKALRCHVAPASWRESERVNLLAPHTQDDACGG